MITVTYVDDVTAEFPDADRWVLVRGMSSNPNHPPTFTADIELRTPDETPVAIIGGGTFKSIVKSPTAA